MVAMNGPGFQSQKSLEVSYTFAKGTSTIDPYVGFGASIGSDTAPYDLATYTGVSYTYQGGAHRVQVQVSDVTDYDDFGMNLPASPAWKTVTAAVRDVRPRRLGRQGARSISATSETSLLRSRGLAGTSGGLKIDNLLLTRSTGPATPDMTIRAAAPPADGMLDFDRDRQSAAGQGHAISDAWLQPDQLAGAGLASRASRTTRAS